jgi:hypothetical protein
VSPKGEPLIVAEDRHEEADPGRADPERHPVEQPPPGQEQRDLRPGDVGRHGVEQGLRHRELAAEGLPGRGHAVHELGHRVEPSGLIALLEPLHRGALGDQALRRILDPHEQGRDQHRDEVAEHAALVRPAHAHRAHRAELDARRRLAVGAQVAPERAGEDRQHDVVHRAAERRLHRAHLGEGERLPGEPALDGQRRVERRRRRGLASDGSALVTALVIRRARVELGRAQQAEGLVGEALRRSW